MSLAAASLQSNVTCRSNQLILFDIKPDTSDLRGFYETAVEFKGVLLFFIIRFFCFCCC